MTQKYVPLAKQSKRKQKEHNKLQRQTWGETNPVTKQMPNAKAYNRKKSKHAYRDHEPVWIF